MSNFERKEAVVKAAKRLLDVPAGEVISLKDISVAAGENVEVRRWIVRSAIDAVNAEYGAVFVSVRKEGYRRVDRAAGAVLVGQRGLRKTRRVARRSQKMAINAARFANEMTGEQRRQHNQQMAALGLIEHLSMDRTVRTMPDAPPKADPLAGLREAIGF